MKWLAKVMRTSLLLFATSVVFGLGCDTEWTTDVQEDVQPAIAIPHYKITRCIAEPTVDVNGLPTYHYHMTYELDNGAWHRFMIFKHPLTDEIIDEAVAAHFRQMVERQRKQEYKYGDKF